MVVNIGKGSSVDLTKEAGGSLTTVRIGLGWDPRTTAGDVHDLDAVAFIIGRNGAVLDEDWFVFYKNLQSPDRSVQHHGDNRDGQGDGDDEVISVDLSSLPDAATGVVIGVSIDKAIQRKQNFGQIRNAYLRILNEDNGDELTHYDLRERFALETAVVLGELYRDGRDWFFRAIGEGHNGGLAKLCDLYGIDTTGG